MGRSGDPRRRASAARGFVGLGQYVEANADRQRAGMARLGDEVATASAAGVHYWTATAMFRLSDTDAAVVAGRGAGTPMLDTENLLEIQSGCFICEQGLRPELLGTRCPGEPEGAFT
jgi:hypothetical protein